MPPDIDSSVVYFHDSGIENFDAISIVYFHDSRIKYFHNREGALRAHLVYKDAITRNSS